MNQKLLSNSIWYLIAQGLTKLISFFYTIFLARNLGVSDFGLYVTALSYFSLVSSLSDFGVNRFFIREVSINKLRLSGLLSVVTFFRIIIVAIFFGLFAIVSSLFDPEFSRRNLTILAVLAVLPQSISLSLDAAFIALLKARYSSIGYIFLTVATSMFGLWLVLSGFGSYGAILGLLLGQILYALVMAILAFWQKVDRPGKIDKALMREVFVGSIPYGILTILGLLYFKVDTLLLSYMKGSFDTGIYGAGYKFLEALVFIPSAVSISLFPMFSKTSQESPAKAYQLYKKSLLTLFLLSLAIMAIYVAVLPILIEIFLPQYAPTISIIRILSLTIPFLFMISPQSTVLSSQKIFIKKLIVISIFNLGLNVALNLIFIPQFSYLASAWITVISDVVGFLIFFWVIRNYYHNHLKNV